MGDLGAYAVGLAAFFGMLWVLIKGAKAAGSAKATLEAQKDVSKIAVDTSKQTVEEINDAKGIHDRLERDPAYRDRVRDRFTRRED